MLCVDAVLIESDVPLDDVVLLIQFADLACQLFVLPPVVFDGLLVARFLLGRLLSGLDIWFTGVIEIEGL